MIRFPELRSQFENLLEKEVSLGGNPVNDSLPFSLENILIPIYESGSMVHKLQHVLDNQDSYSVGTLVNAHKTLASVESVVADLLKSGFDYDPYFVAAAKITDAGDKLDDAIVRTINSITSDFKTKYSSFKKNGLLKTPIRVYDFRKELNALMKDFSSLEKIFIERLLPESNISSSQIIFYRYKSALDNIADISDNISSLADDFNSLNGVEDVRKFWKYASDKIRNTSFRKGFLVKDCKDNHYFEGLTMLKSLNEEVKKALVDSSVYQKTSLSFDRVKDVNSSDYKPIPAPRSSKNFLLSEELDKVDLPKDTRLYVIDDVLRGKISSDGWMSVIDILNHTIDSLSNLSDIEPTAYPMNVYNVFSGFYKNGYLGDVASFSDANKIRIERSLNKLQVFAQKVYA